MRLWLLLLVAAGAARGDASTPHTGGGRSPIWPEARDSIFLGVNRRGEAAFVSRAQYWLPGPTGTVPLLQCRLMLFDAAGALILDARQQATLIRDGHPVAGGWTTASTGAAAEWFRATVPAGSQCDDAVAVLRHSRKWSPPIPSGPARDDWELCGEGAEPTGDLAMYFDGGCYQLQETARAFSSPRSTALIVGQRHFAVAPPGWHLRRREVN